MLPRRSRRRPLSLTSSSVARWIRLATFAGWILATVVSAVPAEETSPAEAEPPPEGGERDAAEPSLPANGGGTDSAAVFEEIPADSERAELAELLTSEETSGWIDRVEAHREGMLAGARTRDEADALFLELSEVLDGKRAELALALETAGDDFSPVERVQRTLVVLYRLRVELLSEINPQLRARVIGSSRIGMRELWDELRHARLLWNYQVAHARERGAYSPKSWVRAPLPILQQTLKLVLVVFLFRLWRSWAAEGLVSARKRLLEWRPRTKGKLRVARFTWYVDRVRRPIEWLVLAEVLFRVIDPGFFEETTQTILGVLRWILIAWFAVAWIYAVSARGAAGLKTPTSKLRLRSLRLLAAWLVLLGLGLDLAETYTGRGTLYAWVWMTFETLALPVALLLVVWWRKTIFASLAREPQTIAVRVLLRPRRGLARLGAAALGGLYLLGLNFVRWIVGELSELEVGRRALANLYHLEVARSASGENDEQERAPIPESLRGALLEGDSGVIDRVAREELKRISDLANQHAAGAVVVVADRGFGKSVLLQRLSRACDSPVLHVDCPAGGYDRLAERLAEALDIDDESLPPETLARAIEESDYGVVTLDNYHRLVRPVIGGQAELDRIASISLLVQRPIVWALSMNTASWRYISCARAHRLSLDEVIELKGWTERELGELIDMRCRQAGVELDFDRIALPRRLDEGQYETLSERNRSGFLRLLWNASSGSPKIALRLWVDSLISGENGRVVVGMPRLPIVRELENSEVTTLLVLRVVLQCELATREVIAESLRITASQTHNALRVALLRGWVNQENGLYRITDPWLGPVMRVLSRRNLLTH